VLLGRRRGVPSRSEIAAGVRPSELQSAHGRRHGLLRVGSAMGSGLSFPALRVIRVAGLQIPAVGITGYPSHGRCSTATRCGIMIRNAWAGNQRARIDGDSKDTLSHPRTHGPSPPLSCESAPSIRVTTRSESPLDPSHPSIRVTPRSDSESPVAETANAAVLLLAADSVPSLRASQRGWSSESIRLG
jgi:hypothetical protein